MLHEFISSHRNAIIDRTRTTMTSRSSPCPSADELEHGVPLFLTQLSETLKQEMSATPFSTDAIGSSAARHGAELRACGFTISQVVHDYGDVCQAITELALERQAPVTTDEFRILNRCLDTAIAEAVTEHTRLTALSRSTDEIERIGHVAHEIRDILNTSILAFETLQKGTVPINGSTATVLGRSLMDLRHFVNNTLSDIRIEGKQQRRERLAVSTLLTDVAAASGLHAEYRGLQFVLEPVDPDLAISGDPQLLGSAVMNLVNNALKFTHTGGLVTLRAHREPERVAIEVEDECGGIADAQGDRFKPFGERRGSDRSGLGLGLSIARKAVEAHGGEIHHRNTPGRGCVFVIEVPLADQHSSMEEPAARRSDERGIAPESGPDSQGLSE